MTHLAHTSSPELTIRLMDPENVQRPARNDPNSWLQFSMPGDGKNSSVTTQRQEENRFLHWLKKTSTAPRAYGAGKVPAATDIDMGQEASMTGNEDHH